MTADAFRYSYRCASARLLAFAFTLLAGGPGDALAQMPANPQANSQERAPEPAPAAPASAPTTNRFDGDWTIRIDCPANTESSGAKGYAYDFPASVLNGRLFGSRGAQGSAGSLQVEGTIAPNGDALLQAHGRTANPEYAASKPAPGTAYSYDIQAHFDGASGHGRRQEQRACDFTFGRR